MHGKPIVPMMFTTSLISIGFSLLGMKPFEFEAKEFDTIVMATLPLLISSDALKMKWDDLKTHGVSLFWVAVISILFFIGLGVLVVGLS